MTIAPASTSVLAEFVGGGDMQQDIAMMIGVGVVKDSEAVFFQYMGEEQPPVALTLPSTGNPLTSLRNVRLVGIDVAEEVGTFKSTKLNLFLESSQGNVVMLTSGLTTLWSQCIVTALSGLYQSYDLNTAFNLNSWKGDSAMRPCFASIKIGQEKISDQMLYDQLRELRADRASDKVLATMRDSVQILKAALNGGDIDAVDVKVDHPNAHPDADF
jgi:hypothetical protein